MPRFRFAGAGLLGAYTYKKTMNTYRSHGHRDVSAADMNEAAQIFANRKARAKYGSGGYARTCNIECWSQDNTLGEYNAFIGYSTGKNETTGNNVRFTVCLNK